MAYTTINKPGSYFNTVLYTGNGSSLSVTGTGFQPDFVWIKGRSGATDHQLVDKVRSTKNILASNLTSAETVYGADQLSFDTNGITVGGLSSMNTSSATYVAWNWLASNTTGSSNTSGTITSTVSANTTSGFSIVSYTGNGTAGATIGHGLGAVPKMMIVKSRGSASAWRIYHASLGNTQGISFDTAVPSANVIFWNNTSPTSTLFTVGTGATVNSNTVTYIAYCFAEVKGFSKFGSYTGNGSTDGTFIYTGFKPAFVLFKNASDGTTSWYILDNKRNTYNIVENVLFPNTADAETTANNKIDMLSNGFKIRTTGATLNGSGNTIIYMAFAENPFVSATLIPTTAR